MGANSQIATIVTLSSLSSGRPLSLGDYNTEHLVDLGVSLFLVVVVVVVVPVVKISVLP